MYLRCCFGVEVLSVHHDLPCCDWIWARLSSNAAAAAESVQRNGTSVAAVEEALGLVFRGTARAPSCGSACLPLEVEVEVVVNRVLGSSETSGPEVPKLLS